MGVKHLWKLISKYGKEENPQNLRLAIDTSIWLHYFKNVPTDIFVYHTFKRILKLLYNKNKPVFVFDSSFPLQKKKTILERQRRNAEDLAKKYIRNVQCRICNKSYRECEHANVEKKEIIQTRDNEMIDTIKTSAPETWGNYYDEHVKILESEDFVNLTKTQKLNVLIELREKRKLPTKYTINDGMDFSIEQINNLRKRNKVTEWINKLENEHEKRVMSDCNKIFIFKEEIAEKNNLSEIKESIEDVFEDIKILPDLKFDEKNLQSETVILKDTVRDIEEDFIWDDDSSSSKENEISYVEQRNTLISESDEIVNDPENPVNDFEKTISDTINTINDPEILKSDIILTGDLNFKKEKKDNFVLPSFNASISENEKNIESIKNVNICEIHAKNNFKLEPETRIEKDLFIENYQIDSNLLIDDLLKMKIFIKEIIKIFNLPYIDAPVEADSQCAYLSDQDLVDGIISEDNDIFLFGGKCLFRNYFKKDKSITRFNLTDIESFLTRKDMIKYSYYTGSDYSVGVRGIGPKKAFELLSKKEEIDLDVKLLENLYFNPQVKKVLTIDWPEMDFKNIEKYIVNMNLSESRKVELCFHLRKISDQKVLHK